MDFEHWLARERASFMPAGQATAAEARLIHDRPAGLHAVRSARSAHQVATARQGRAAPVADRDAPNVPRADENYYSELAQGAQYLAAQASDAVEIAEHGRMATLYLLRARAAAWGESLRR